MRIRSGDLHRWKVLFGVLGLVGSIAPGGGCGLDIGYAVPAVFGQLNVLLNARPVDEVLASDRLTAEQRSKVELVVDVRTFAHDHIGLTVDNSYVQYFDAGDRPVAYNISAARRDAFEPLTWTFPFVGTVPQLGYFDRWLLDAKVAELSNLGYDVFAYELDAYYLGPFLPNPITSTLLQRDEVDLVSTVIHELTHATVGRASNAAADANFNESMATFVGQTGAVEYYQDRFPSDAARVQSARDRFEDEARYASFIDELYAELSAFYGSDRTSAEKIAGREALFEAARTRFADEVQALMHDPSRYDFAQELPANNAYMLLQHRYNLSLDAFDAVYQATGGRWPQTLSVFREAAATAGDPFAYLGAWANP
jgi:predicted aminopeptidase